MKKIILFTSFFLLGSVLNLYSQNKPIDDNAEFYSQKVQPNMKAGETYTVKVTFKNTGAKTWDKGEYWIIYTDPRMSAMNNNVWGVDSVAIKKNVKKGNRYEFKFTVTAPQEPGIYFFGWMLCNRNGTFGFGSDMQQILVSK